jgi:hypothetical protein
MYSKNGHSVYLYIYGLTFMMGEEVEAEWADLAIGTVAMKINLIEKALQTLVHALQFWPQQSSEKRNCLLKHIIKNNFLNCCIIYWVNFGISE